MRPALITLIPKLDTEIIRKLQTDVCHKCRYRNPQKNISKSNPNMLILYRANHDDNSKNPSTKFSMFAIYLKDSMCP